MRSIVTIMTALSLLALKPHPIGAKTAVLQAPTESGFVKTQNSHFQLDSHPFYFQGGNFYRLGLIDRQSDEQVYDIAAQLAAKGIKVLRIWGFACGNYSTARPILKSVTGSIADYDQAALHRLDLAIDAARKAGLKIILPLVNGQDEYCSMSWWVKQVKGAAITDSQLFYTDQDVRNAFKRHVAYILTRANSVYFEKRNEVKAYNDDPVIMAIELANEPHTTDHYEENLGRRSGEIIYNWLSEMSDYVRSIDPNHLITSGEEGYKTTFSTVEQSTRHPWLSDGTKGVDFVRNISLPNIDFATVHAYPGNWYIPSADFDWFEQNYLLDRASIAHGEHKPVVLEEIGFSSDRSQDTMGYSRDPASWLSRMLTDSNNAGYAATMFWQIVPPGTEEGDFNFDFNTDVAKVLFIQATKLNQIGR